MAEPSTSHGAEDIEEPGSPGPNLAALAAQPEKLLDELIPEELDWRGLVRSYPVPALLVAAAGGFFLGSRKGEAIVAALGAFVSEQVSHQVNQALGGDLL